jgi:hypothetical protein
MDQTLSIGWTRAAADARCTAFRRVLGVNLAVQVIVGVTAVTAPRFLCEVLGLGDPSPAGWVRAWGWMVLAATALYVPGLRDPTRARWPNVVGILSRYGIGLLFLAMGGGFLWLAAFDLAFAIALSVLYLQLLKAELMSRP